MFARNQKNYNNPFQRVGITHNELEILSQLMTPFFSYLNILAILDWYFTSLHWFSILIVL